MRGNVIAIYLDSEPVACSTECSLNVQQEAVEYTPLPGTVTEEEAEWKHYRKGDYSWSVGNGSFLTFESAKVLEAVGNEVGVDVAIGDGSALVGTGIVKSAIVEGNVNSLAKMSVNIEGNDLPTMED